MKNLLMIVAAEVSYRKSIMVFCLLMLTTGCLAVSSGFDNSKSKLLIGMSEEQVRAIAGAPKQRSVDVPNCVDPYERVPMFHRPRSGPKCEGTTSTWPKDLDIPIGVEIVNYWYSFSEINSYSYPTTVTTNVIGNTAYSTVRQGGTSETNNRCSWDLWFVSGQLYITGEPRGNSC